MWGNNFMWKCHPSKEELIPWDLKKFLAGILYFINYYKVIHKPTIVIFQVAYNSWFS